MPQIYARTGRLPVGHDEQGVHREIRRADVRGNTVKENPLRSVETVERAAFSKILQTAFSEDVADIAVNGLYRSAPASSAKFTLSGKQLIAAVLIFFAMVVGFFLSPLSTLILINVIATLYFLITMGFRIYLSSITMEHKISGTTPCSVSVDDPDLPSVTILSPLFREADALPSLARAIDALEYPTHLLDVKIILEEDDEQTRREVDRLGLDQYFDIIIVPHSNPKTKPKACNFALAYATGELTVIYDAEDIPDTDQLLKAVEAFRRGPDELICVQAQLNFYNRNDNWLTRLFALEYALWFDNLLPALRKLNAPIPLGGTSNIFKTKALRELGAWDPYNVTEDADLGIRIARHGGLVGLIDSTTYEEANARLGNWLRQRSRWMKGYLQTWLVDMRAPKQSSKPQWRSALSTQLFVAGTVLSALLNPIFWGIFIYWVATKSQDIAVIFPEPLLSLNLFTLLFGNSVFLFLTITAPLKRGWPELAPAAFLVPV